MIMEVIILIGILIVLGITIYNLIKSQQSATLLKNLLSKEDSEETEEREETVEQSENPTSEQSAPEHNPDAREKANREVLVEIFDGMGCNPSVNEEGHLSFSYQGENFLIMFNGAFIRIWDLSWHSVKPTDDNYTLLKDATNYANFSFGPTIVLHSPDENGNIIFSSRMDIPFVAEMRDAKGYITAILDAFFALKNSLHREIARLKDDPHDRTLHNNPIGFDTASLSDPSSPQAN